MKRAVLILIAAVLAGVVGFAISRWQTGSNIVGKAGAAGTPSFQSELEWLRREFQLTEEQFAKASELHFAYRPTCESLCEKVLASRGRIAQLVGTEGHVTPELEAALREQATLRVECQTAMLTHLYQTAACLSPDQAKAYLEAMLPEVMDKTMEPGITGSGH